MSTIISEDPDNYILFKGQFLEMDLDRVLWECDPVIVQHQETWARSWFSDHSFYYGVLKPDILPDLLKKLQKTLKILTGRQYDSVLVNYYPDGIGYYPETTQQTWADDSCIIWIGIENTFNFSTPDKSKSVVKFHIQHGDLLYMKNKCHLTSHTGDQTKSVGASASLIFSRRKNEETSRF